MKNMTINLRENNKSEQIFSKGSHVEFYIQHQNYQGWIDAVIKEIRGEFYLVEYSTDHKLHTKILTKNNLRIKTNVIETFELNTVDNDIFTFKMDYLTMNYLKKIKKIENVIKHIKNLIEMNFIYYSRNLDSLIVFIEKGNDFEKIEILNCIMQTVENHYVFFII